MTANQNVKDVIELLAQGFSDVEKILVDGKVSLAEIGGEIGLLLKIPTTVPKVPLAFEELKSADTESKLELVSYIDNTIIMNNKKTEAIVKGILVQAVFGINLFASLTATPVVALPPSA